MTDLFHDTLNHLKDSPTDKDIDITDFLKSLSYVNANTTDGTISIFRTFENLKSKHLVIPLFTNLIGQTINTDKSGQDYVIQNSGINFDNIKAIVNITSDAKKYLEQRKRDERQDGLLTLQANSITSQRRLTRLALWIAGVSAAATVATLVKEIWLSHPILEPETKQQIDKQVITLDSLKQSLQNIDSTLRHAVYDSLKKI
jgi:hypothetical protein